MTTEIQYCIQGPDGGLKASIRSQWRKSVEIEWLSICPEQKKKVWRYWYRHGWRIKKVKVTIEIL
jgi:hypothetical protein